MKKYSVKVMPNSKYEEFSSSTCDCRACNLMHLAQIEWDTFVPQTHLQKGMKAAISKIEARLKKKI